MRKCNPTLKWRQRFLGTWRTTGSRKASSSETRPKPHEPFGIRRARLPDMGASRVAVSFTCLSLIWLASLPVSAEPQVSVFRLQALNASGVREGTCFVIRQEKRAEGTFLVLVTSARLFDRETGRRARVFLDGEKAVDIAQEAISTPYDNMRDIAVLKAVVKTPPLSTLPVVFDTVPAGTPFFVAGLRPDGRRTLVAQHVRFCATRMVVGDGSTAALAGCQGAPAIIERGVFGVVSECGPDRVPEITPLAVSRNFLLRTVPELGEVAPGAPKFRIEEHEVKPKF